MKFDEIYKNLIENKKIVNKQDDKGFLENIIRVFEELNIFVFEFVDKKRKFEKISNFNGLFMSPNLIVIKRQQKYFRREIFTLIHELGHYLLNTEEVDNETEDSIHETDKLEEWCNLFAFNFLLGEQKDNFESIDVINKSNNFHEEKINNLIAKTKLSKFAIFTSLKLRSKISDEDYYNKKREVMEAILAKEEKEKRALDIKKDLAKANGEVLFMTGPKEIKSKLFEDLVKINYFEGKISELEVREHLKIKQNKTVEEVILG